MTRKRPWFPFYAADWLGDEQVTLLPLAAQGAYVRLLAHSWIEGSIPSSCDAIGVLLGDRRAGRKLWPLLAQFWEPKQGDPSRLVNARLESVRAEQNAYSADQRERGRLGNAARAAARQRPEDVASANASALVSASANGSQARSHTRPEVRGENQESDSQNERYPKPKPNPACLLSGTVPPTVQDYVQPGQIQKASKLFLDEAQNPDPAPEPIGPIEFARRAALDAVLKNLTHDPPKNLTEPADIPRVYGEP